jgi:hypothetical protein
MKHGENMNANRYFIPVFAKARVMDADRGTVLFVRFAGGVLLSYVRTTEGLVARPEHPTGPAIDQETRVELERALWPESLPAPDALTSIPT